MNDAGWMVHHIKTKGWAAGHAPESNAVGLNRTYEAPDMSDQSPMSGGTHGRINQSSVLLQ